MDTQPIRILLDKFEKATTSLEEERVLREYFLQHEEIPAELELYRAYFQYCESAGITESRNAALEAGMENWIERNTTGTRFLWQNRKIYRWVAAAAMIVLIGTTVLIMNRNRKPDLGTFSDPELAYIEARKTMLYISQTLNYGTRELSNISKINSGVESLRNLEKLNSGLSKLQMLSKIEETKTEEKQ